MIPRSRSWLSGLIWALAAWILIMQLYMALTPPQLVRFDARSYQRSLAKLEHTHTHTRYTNSSHRQHDLEEMQLIGVIDPVNPHENDRNFFLPGRLWLDSDGNIIQAHGGGILYVPSTGIFYWYGENKDGPTYFPSPDSLARVDLIGVSCYSSRDLWKWKYEGLVLKGDRTNRSSDLYYKNVLERPKVVYNERTKLYVMWMHIDNANYSKASLGVAVSPKPEGPFEYLGSKQPHAFESRDMTLFKDEDGTAYIVYSSEDNSALHISPLDEEYMEFRNIMSRVFVDEHREAPAVFKHRGVYYMVTSGCTGWEPNEALLHTAENILGPWVTVGNPCFGSTPASRATTFQSQGSFVLPLPGLPNMFVFTADRWNSTELRNSSYVWLPLTMDGPVDEPVQGFFEFPFWLRVSIRWYRKWRLPQGWDHKLRLE